MADSDWGWKKRGDPANAVAAEDEGDGDDSDATRSQMAQLYGKSC